VKKKSVKAGMWGRLSRAWNERKVSRRGCGAGLVEPGMTHSREHVMLYISL